jgi:hypothetical protein
MDDGTSNLESKNVCTSVGWFSFNLFLVKITGFDSPNHFKEAQVLIKKKQKNL